MSLSDIVEFVGPKSVPAIVALTVYGVFGLGEKLASQRAKDALSKWLLTFDVRKVGAMPDGTRELFERIFGKRHFSTKCFVRSAAFSLGAMIFVTLMLFLIAPSKALVVATSFVDNSQRLFPRYGYWLLFLLWLPWSILLDYISLLKTRVVLGIFAGMRRATIIGAFSISIIDYISYRVLFQFAISALTKISLYIYTLDIYTLDMPTFPESLVRWALWDIYKITIIPTSYLPPSITDDPIQDSIFFWSGFAPSLWMWLYVLALFTTRAILRSEKLIKWLRWFLDIEKAPFRSIGAVAAVLAFIALVAILLISAEISRITAAA